MAGLLFTLTVERTADGDPETLIQVVAPAQQRVLILGYLLGGLGGTPASTNSMFYFAVQTTAGTASGLSAAKYRSIDSESIQTTAQKTFTVEPTTTTRLATFTVHEQGGLWFYFPEKYQIVVPGGSRVGAVVSKASAWPNLSLELLCEE